METVNRVEGVTNIVEEMTKPVEIFDRVDIVIYVSGVKSGQSLWNT